MKAVLVVDIPDDYDEYGIGDWYIIPNEYGDELSIVYEEDGALIHYRDIDDMAQLKPMPEKKNPLDDCGMFHGKGIQGWNACIDEILGEEEWVYYLEYYVLYLFY